MRPFALRPAQPRCHIRSARRLPRHIEELSALRCVLPILLLALVLSAAGCERHSGSDSGTASNASSGNEQTASGTFERPQQPDDGLPVILVLGDSLAAGHGLPSELSFPALLQKRLAENDYPHRVVNAGVSGDTSAGGLARLDWLLKQRVDIMILELGANDGLRGQDPAAMRENLAKIIERAKAGGIRVLLTGMRMPSNYGPDYTRRYAAVFPELAERYDLPFVPFLLEGVAMHPDLNQPDGIHPNAEGARVVADNVWAVLQPMLEP